MRQRLGLGLAVSLGLATAIGNAAAWAQGAQGGGRFDGQYIGELALNGIVSGDCTQPPQGAVYPLTIAGGAVSFAYLPRFATTLTGRVDAKGNFTAAARVPSGTIRMTGHTDGIHLAGAIASPSCRYTYRAQQ